MLEKTQFGQRKPSFGMIVREKIHFGWESSSSSLPPERQKTNNMCTIHKFIMIYIT